VSGSVEVVILTELREFFYLNRLVEDYNVSYEVLEGNRSEIIEMYLNNFTGKLKFQLIVFYNLSPFSLQTLK